MPPFFQHGCLFLYGPVPKCSLRKGDDAAGDDANWDDAVPEDPDLIESEAGPALQFTSFMAQLASLTSLLPLLPPGAAGCPESKPGPS